MTDKYYENLVKEIKKKLNFPDIEFPDMAGEEVDHNFEMISIEQEDWILLFQKGFITGLQLASLLNGREWEDVIGA